MMISEFRSELCGFGMVRRRFAVALGNAAGRGRGCNPGIGKPLANRARVSQAILA
jgi:hypothetical protein